ncbi:MAG: ABC transporter permease [Bryobacteraceae bacterium]|jgi:putative ABC transport system permease protein
MVQDFRHTLRVLRGSPGVTAAALAALALGTGANTAIFGLMDTVLLRPLPYPHADRLMSVDATEKGRAMAATSWPMFRDWQEQTRVFERLAGYTADSANLTGSGEPLRVNAAQVSPEMFPVLGASPLAGALGSNAQSAVLSYGFWMRRFGGERQALGRTLIVDGKPYSVAGVLGSDFRFPRWSWMEEPDIYLPLEPSPNRRMHYVRVIGRLKPGVTVAQAKADMDLISAAIERAYPTLNRGEGAAIIPLHEELTGGTRKTLTAFGAAAFLVLLIACANVSNLLLSQAMRRRREIAIRSALGASRARLVMQFLAESLVLATCGGAVGVLLATWGMPLLVRAAPAHTQLSTRLAMGGLGLNWAVLGFAVALSFVAAAVSGILPAWRASRLDGSAQHLGSRGERGERTRGILITAEVALSLVLLAGAGLLMKSFFRLLAVDPGFNVQGLLTIGMELPENKYPEVEQRAEFVKSVLGRLESIPGVRAAAAINVMPLTKTSSWNSFHLPGSSQEIGEAGFRAVTPGYFEAMGIPLVRGRFPVRGDSAVGVINQSMARRYWPHEDPVGKAIETPRVVTVRTAQGWDMRFIPTQFRIVGIVGDIRHLALEDGPQPEMFLLYSQMATSDFTFLLRSSVDPMALAHAARKEIWAVDHDQPLAAVRTMDELIGQDVAGRRFVLLLLIVFAALAVTLAAAGIFAVISHAVSQRTREIGIRIALGADAPSVIRTMVRQTMLWIGAGLFLGAGGALAAGRLLNSYLFAVQPRDPAALGMSVAGLAAVAVLAAFIPARGAARIDPAITLRYE